MRIFKNLFGNKYGNPNPNFKYSDKVAFMFRVDGFSELYQNKTKARSFGNIKKMNDEQFELLYEGINLQLI